MKTKLFKNIGYLLFILFALSSCVDEMDMIEDEQGLSTNLGRSPSPEIWIKNLIDYENSTADKNAIAKVENFLENLYRFVPDIQYVIDDLIGKKAKISYCREGQSRGKLQSWYEFDNYHEIGFNGNGMITLERVLHELLHMFSFNTYKGLNSTCEEYEIRVLTDLYMCRYFKTHVFDYQGVYISDNPEDILFAADYKAWLDEIINNKDYPINSFTAKFKIYGGICISKLNDKNLNYADIKKYTPVLAKTLWFYGKKE